MAIGTFTKKISATEIAPTEIIKTVAATGTPEQLTSTETYARSMTVWGKKAAQTNNTSVCYIGRASGNGTQSIEIPIGEPVVIKGPEGTKFDLSDWYIDVGTNGDGVVVWYDAEV